MAVKEASVRLELKDSGFRRGVRGAEAEVKKGAKGMGGALKSEMSRGAKGGLDALKGMFSTIKSGFKSVAGLAGGIGMGVLLKSAVDVDTQFRKLAFTVSAGSGVIVDHNSLMKQAQKLAAEWGVSANDLGTAMETVFDTTGDLDFATLTLEDIAKAARSSGHEVSTIAPMVAELNRQFGVTAEEVPDALAALLDLGTRGGLSIEELGAGLGDMGKSAKLAGLSGVSGMKTMIGLINQFTAASGSAGAATSNVDAILRRLVSDVAVMDKMKKEFKIDVVGEGLSAVDALKRLLKATKGDEAELGKIFTEKGGIIAGAFKGITDFDAAIAKAAETTFSAAALTKRANENKKTAEAQIAIGIEKLKQAFTKPEIIDALTRLAQTLPAMAEAVTAVVDFIASNPITAGAAGAAAVFGKGAIGASMSAAPIIAAMNKGGGGAAGQMKQGIVSGGGLAATAMAGAFMAAGVAAAYEQASALKKELGAETWGEVPGKLVDAFADMPEGEKRQDANLVRMGAEQGVQAQRDFRPGETLAGDKPFFAPDQVFLGDERNAEGNVETVARATRTMEGGGVDAVVAAIEAAVARKAAGQGGYGVRQPEEAYGVRVPDPAVAAQANARALATQLQASKLQVNLVNVDQLSTSIANAMPKTITPGNKERP